MLSPGTACSVNYGYIIFLTDGQRRGIEVVRLSFGDAKLSGNLLILESIELLHFKDLSDEWVLPIHHFADLFVLKFGIELFGHADSRLGLSFLLFPVCKLNELNSIEKMTATNKTAKRTHICKRYHNSKV